MNRLAQLSRATAKRAYSSTVSEELARSVSSLKHLLSTKREPLTKEFKDTILDTYRHICASYLSASSPASADGPASTKSDFREMLGLELDAALGLFHIALESGSYSHFRSIYAHALAASRTEWIKSTSSLTWRRVFHMAERENDPQAIQCYIFDIRAAQGDRRILDTELLNIYLSACLADIERSGSTRARSPSSQTADSALSRSDACVTAILSLFASLSIPINSDSVQLILCHYIHQEDYERLAVLLPRLLALGIQLDATSLKYLFYVLGHEKGLVSFCHAIYQKLKGSPSLNAATSPVHQADTIEILLEAYLDNVKNFDDTWALYRDYMDALQRTPANFPASDHSFESELMRSDLFQRIIHACLIHSKFVETQSVLVDMKAHKIPITSPIYEKIFQYIATEESDSARLQKWINLLLSKKDFTFDDEMRSAVLKLSSRVLLPEEFLAYIEKLY